jgi:hypothetical protein
MIKDTLTVAVSFDGNLEATMVGVPQGSPLSPLYSNIYLNLIDQLWHSRKYPEKLGATIHRYADDVVIVCRKNGRLALSAFTALARKLDLTINEQKTKITTIQEGFDFIGFEFIKRKSPNTGKPVVYIFPSLSSQKSIRQRIRRISSRRAQIKPAVFIRNMNLVVGGWTNYHRHGNAAKTFRRLQKFIENRTRRYLTCRRKGRGFGFDRYPTEELYKMGLIQIHSGLVPNKKKKFPVHASQ